MTTPKTASPELVESQADKEETVNEAVRRVEVGASHYLVVDKDLTAPPGSCADGACYIVAATATGDWAGHEGEIAIAVGTNASNGWYFRIPEEGVLAWVQDETPPLHYWDNSTSPGSWQDYATGVVGSLALDDLTDVDTSSSPGKVDGDALVWNAGAGLWVPGEAVAFASSTETTAGSSTTKAVTPNGLRASDYGKRFVQLLAGDDYTTALTTGDGKDYFAATSELNGWNMVGVFGLNLTQSSSGAPNFQVARIRAGTPVDVLSTALTIDANENDSSTAATPAVINASNDDVATGDVFRLDCDGAGTGTAGAIVTLIFQKP